MKQITVSIEGMHCPKCAAKVQDAISDKFAVQSVVASANDKNAVIVCENDLDDEAITAVVASLGFTVVAVTHEDYKKRGLIAKIFKKS
ncbi:MAG: cation transporter [Clostridia bacterium]|nr:cation transporter [Clostridia bacterium]